MTTLDEDEYEVFLPDCQCEDVPIISYCPKCNNVYAINKDDGSRRELIVTIEELMQFIKEKEDNGGYIE